MYCPHCHIFTSSRVHFRSTSEIQVPFYCCPSGWVLPCCGCSASVFPPISGQEDLPSLQECPHSTSLEITCGDGLSTIRVFSLSVPLPLSVEGTTVEICRGIGNVTHKQIPTLSPSLTLSSIAFSPAPYCSWYETISTKLPGIPPVMSWSSSTLLGGLLHGLKEKGRSRIPNACIYTEKTTWKQHTHAHTQIHTCTHAPMCAPHTFCIQWPLQSAGSHLSRGECCLALACCSMVS